MPRGKNSRAAKRGCFKRGGFPIWTCPSFFVLFLSFLGLSRFFLGLSRFFWDFPDLLGVVQGFSRFVRFLFLGLLRAPTRNSPERVHDTIWTFPEKSGKHPGLETPQFSFSQKIARLRREKFCRSIAAQIASLRGNFERGKSPLLWDCELSALANKGLPLPLGRGVCETKSKNGRSRRRKPFISRVFCAQKGLRPWSQTMVSIPSDHGVGVDPETVSAPNHTSQIASDFKSRSPNPKSLSRTLQIAVQIA